MKFFTCKICDLKYSEKKWAVACEKFCSTHSQCSPEIAKHAVK